MSFAYSLPIAFIYINSFLVFLAPVAHSDFFPGEVSPSRLEIPVGSSANITCRMNLTLFNESDSSLLYFTESGTKTRVPMRDTTVVNASTIVYTLRNAKEQDRRYTCLIGGKGIAEAHVVVGTPPTEVNDFDCRNYDYKYVVCNFTIPHNTIDVKYDLSYHYENEEVKYICELEKIDDGKYAICNITDKNGRGFQNKEYINFTLVGNNSLGSKNRTHRINNFESVIPGRPELKLTKKTNNSATFFWPMETYFYKKKKGFKYEVRLMPERFDWIDYTDYHVSPDKRGYELELKNLPYAFYNYTLSLRIRINLSSESSNVNKDLWSKSSYIEFKTSSCLPDAPPTTDVGSFDLIDTTDPRVRLYWKQRPFYRENGEDFQYKIQVHIDGYPVVMDPIRIDRTSAEFSWDRRSQYKFIIRSYNKNGFSLDSSSIIVPVIDSKHVMDYTADWIRSVYRKSNRTFTISWNPPRVKKNMVDYTVFWCHPKPALSNECNDSVQFKHVSKNITQFTTEPHHQEHAIIFAVSANYVTYTTGMHWSMCTADISKDLIKMHPEYKSISSREISLTWNLMKECPSILEGYNLTYCAITNAYNEQCLQQNTSSVLIEKNATSYVVSGLKPYTRYKFQIYMYSEMKKGKPSDTKVVFTKEEAPSSPRNLELNNITSNSVWLTWLPPIEMNGKLRSYTVRYCSKLMGEPCHSNSVNASELNYKLELLSSYTYYSVFVLANTVEASAPSNIVHFKTLVGIPSSPRRLTLDKNNTILQWTQGDLTSERVDFYEISIELYHKDIKKEEHVYGVINATSCVFSKPSCTDKDYVRIVRVRAVTAASRFDPVEVDMQLLADNITDGSPNASYFTEDSSLKCKNTESSEAEQLLQWKRFHDSEKFILYKSHWERGITYGCGNPKAPIMAFLNVFGAFCALVIAVFLFRTSYDKIKRMLAIRAVLPELLRNESKDIQSDQSSDCVYNAKHEESYVLNEKTSYQNEQRSLLTWDSTCSPTSPEVSAMGISKPPILSYAGSKPLTTNDYRQADDFQAKFEPATTNDNAYTIMQTPRSNQEISMEIERSIPKSIYVKPNQSWSMLEDLTTSQADGTAVDLNLMPTISSAGYVETGSNKKSVDPTCCTTLEALHRKHPGELSGYVKPNELFAMGQQRCS